MYLDLLEQAEQLASLDPKRPRQANLRRAISTCDLVGVLRGLPCARSGGLHHTSRHATRSSRVSTRPRPGYAHSTMKQACVAFRGGTLKASVRKGLPASFRIHSEIQGVAKIFFELQEKRHLADYDLTERFRRSEVQTLIRNARQGISAFTQLPSSNEKKFFLACLWAWKELTNR